MNRFPHHMIDEWEADWWKTTPLASTRNRWDSLCNVAAVIAQYFVPHDWRHRLNEGSITFQSKIDNHQVVTIFIDEDSRLARKLGLQLNDHPIVVAAELSAFPPFVRCATREQFREMFGPLYFDSENAGKKLRLNPNEDHCFDIIFLKDEPCKFSVDKSIAGRIMDLLETGKVCEIDLSGLIRQAEVSID